jgi:hypothetical protein
MGSAANAARQAPKEQDKAMSPSQSKIVRLSKRPALASPAKAVDWPRAEIAHQYGQWHTQSLVGVLCVGSWSAQKH